MLYGEDDAHLSRIEKKFNVTASSRGNVLALSGEQNPALKPAAPCWNRSMLILKKAVKSARRRSMRRYA